MRILSATSAGTSALDSDSEILYEFELLASDSLVIPFVVVCDERLVATDNPGPEAVTPRTLTEAPA